MASYANTALANITIDLKWDQDLLMARYANSVIMPRVLNKSAKVKQSGQRVSIQIKAKLTTGTVATGGGFTPSAPAPTQANVDVNTWKYVAIEIDDQAKAQSFWDPNSDFPSDAGKALAVQYDIDLAALQSTLTGLAAVGDPATPEAFDDIAARTAMLRLANANIPMDDLSFILPPIAWFQGWLAKTELTAAYATGLPKSLNNTAAKQPILGVPAFITTVLATSGTAIKGMLIHKEAFAIAFQMEHEYRLVDRTPAQVFSKMGCTESLYGVATIRSDHGVVINVRNT